jgi:hypothetical protein
LAAAKAMLRDSEVTVEEVARRLGVAPLTLYRHLPRIMVASRWPWRPRCRTAAINASISAGAESFIV